MLMNPANSERYALAQKRCNLLSKVKKNGIAELFSAASDIGAMAGLEDHVCLALLKAASEKNELLSKESLKLREKTIVDGLAEGRRLAMEQAPSIVPQGSNRVADVWEDVLAQLPAHIIHRCVDGRELVTSADIATHVLNVPIDSGIGGRIAKAMTLAGWHRHRSGLIKIGSKSHRGYWRFSKRWGAANDADRK